MRYALAPLLALASCAPAPVQGPTRAAAAPDLHSRLLTLDTHLDTSLHFSRAGWSFADRHDPSNDISQVDLPRMGDGALDGGFFVIYTAQGPLTPAGFAAARDFALRRSDEIDATIARHGPRIAAVRSVAEARWATAAGKLLAFKSIENSYPLGEDLGLLAEFHRRGVRMAGPVHSTNNQFADSATDKPRWNGLSPLGERWVAEMNRLGMVIDASHSSDAAFDRMLALSKTPMILSHSGSRTMFDHPRNLDDARIRKLAAAGGAICVTSVYLSPMQLGPARAALFAKFEEIGSLSPAEQAELSAQWRAMDAAERLWTADFERFMAAVLHVIKVAGVDHVCFGADWDGGGGLAGMDDISALPKVTERLKAAGYSDRDLAKMWAGNVLRLLDRARAAARAD